jgi:hypothetical protein
VVLHPRAPYPIFQNVPDLLVVLTLMKKVRCVGSPTIKCVAWLQRIRKVIVVKVLLHIFVASQLSIDVAFPHFNHIKAMSSKVFSLLQSSLIEIVDGFFVHLINSIPGITV